MALGLVLVYKATGVLNFAQGEIGTVAIYVAWVLSTPKGEETGRFLGVPIKGWGVGIFVGLIVALVVAAALGALMERLIIRRLLGAPRLTLTVVTLGVSTVLGGLQFVIWGENPHGLTPLVTGSGPKVGGVFLQPGRMLAIFVTIALGTALFLFFKRTLFGLGVLAASQNPTSLRLMGMSLSRVSLFTWSSAGVIAALAGIILSPTIGSFHPFFMTLILIPSLAGALVGGLNSLPGAFVGGVTVGIAENLIDLASDVAGIKFAVNFVLIVAILLFRPRGLLGSAA